MRRSWSWTEVTDRR